MEHHDHYCETGRHYWSEDQRCNLGNVLDCPAHDGLPNNEGPVVEGDSEGDEA